MNHNNLQFRLSAYSAMAASFMLTYNSADAQIIYTDVIPDKFLMTTGPYDSLHLDVTGDAVADFVFNASYSYSSYASADNSGNIAMMGVGGARIAYTFDSTMIYNVNFSSTLLIANPTANLAKQLPAGSPINPSLNFLNQVQLFNQDCYPAMFSTIADYCWTAGLPVNNTKYIGFRLKFGPLKYYGWMRVAIKNNTPYVPTATSVYIYDYAINWTPNSPINAGQGLVCISPSPLETATVAPHWAKVVWEPLVDVNYYEVQYRTPGAAWESKLVSPVKSNVKLTGLACNTSYDWQIRCACAGGTLSEFSEIQNFTTASCREDDGISNGDLITIYNNASNLYINFPSPIEGTASLVIYNMLGQFIMQTELTAQENVINLDLPSGMYAVNVISSGGSADQLISVVK